MRKLGLAMAVPSAAVLLVASLPATAAENLGTSHGVRYVRSVVTMPAASGTATTKAARPKCPVGWKAVSGGSTIAAGFNRAIGTTTLGGARYWYTEAWQTVGGATKLAVYSICRKTDGLSSNTKSKFALDPGQNVDTASCENGHAVGGGLRSIGNAEKFSWNSSRPTDGPDADLIPDDGWTTWVHYNGTDNGSSDAVLFDVVCIDGPTPTYVSAMATVNGNHSGGVNVRCPAGTTVIGGSTYADGTTDTSHIIASRPWDSGDAHKVPDDGWRGEIDVLSDSDRHVTAWAVCR